jgi:hypothetical protein
MQPSLVCLEYRTHEERKSKPDLNTSHTLDRWIGTGRFRQAHPHAWRYPGRTYDLQHTETSESMPPNLDVELLVGSSSPEAVKKFKSRMFVRQNVKCTLPDVETTAEHKHVMISPKRSTRFEFFL